MPKSELQPTPELRRILERFCNGRVPEGWSLRRLDDLAARGTGHTPDRKKSHYWNGGVKWISLADSHRLDQVYISDTEHSISNAGLDNSSAVLHPPGIVVLSRDAGVGKSAVTTCPLAVSQHFVVWDCGSALHNLYLYYWLQLLKPEFERIANGSTIKTIGMGYFDRLQILVPGREVQEPIAEMLLTWDAAITAVRKLVRRRRKLKRGLSQQLLTGERRFPEFRNRAWEHVRIGDLLREVERHVEWSDDESYRLVSVRRRSGGFFDRGLKSGREILTKSLKETHAGDFVLARMQVLHGAMTITPPGFHGAHVSDSYMTFVPQDPSRLHMPYLGYLSTTREMYYKAFRSSFGVAIEKMTFQPRWWLNETVYLPNSIEEQRRITDVLETLGREIQLLTDLHEASKEQKKGLMQQLLTGKVRVPESMLTEAAHA